MKIHKPLVIFIMGVSGVGKSTIGALLSEKLSIPFFDGDDYHPESNIEKMAGGEALNDDDRYEWLQRLNKLAQEHISTNSCIIACSALKESYRALLQKDIETQVKWVFLNGTYGAVLERLKDRQDHFMPNDLLRSQFDILEEPIEGLSVDIRDTPKEITALISDELNKSEIGLIGLGVMGKSLSRNLASKNFTLSLFNRHIAKKEERIAHHFINEFKELSSAKPFDDLAIFVKSLQRPRKILLMVNAGEAVDSVIDKLSPLLSANDVIIDGGNSHYEDTQRRIDNLKEHKIHFIGAGISGGEEGALLGPSIMPGGDKKGYKLIQPFLEIIAAKGKQNKPCCTYVGPDGSGHFVKMVHNGIEYVEMQLLAEVYQILRKTGRSPDQIAYVLEPWLQEASSYLLEITIDILKKKEGADFIIDTILDVSGNKGTGNWTTIASTKLGVPSTLIATALFARYLSSFKNERLKMAATYEINNAPIELDIEALYEAYQLARVVNHHQGFKLIFEASQAYKWSLNLEEIASIWTNGCIIRSSLMTELADALKKSNSILLNTNFTSRVQKWKLSLTKIVMHTIKHEISVPCLSEAINFINGYIEAESPANLIQAQRDYFGAHTYQRSDDISGKFYHTDWKKNNK